MSTDPACSLPTWIKKTPPPAPGPVALLSEKDERDTARPLESESTAVPVEPRLCRNSESSMAMLEPVDAAIALGPPSLVLRRKSTELKETSASGPTMTGASAVSSSHPLKAIFEMLTPIPLLHTHHPLSASCDGEDMT